MSSSEHPSSLHESFSRKDNLVPGSERSFGTIMAAAVALVALLNFWHNGRAWPWMAGLSCLFLTAAFLWPALLQPLNWLWFRFGLLLHAVVNPVVMALLFYGAVWPTAVVMRALGKDSLRLKREPLSETYWIARSPPGPRPDTMKDQF